MTQKNENFVPILEQMKKSKKIRHAPEGAKPPQSKQKELLMTEAASWVKQEMQDYLSACSFTGKDPESLPYFRAIQNAHHDCENYNSLFSALEEIVECEKRRRDDLKTLSMKPGSLYEFSAKRVEKAEAALAKAQAFQS